MQRKKKFKEKSPEEKRPEGEESGRKRDRKEKSPE
jgi:hypothetical protein